MTVNVPDHVDTLLKQLMNVRPTRDGWVASCPCPGHNPQTPDGDQHPSLAIRLGDDGRILIRCHVGCQTDAVLEALGLGWTDVFAPSDYVPAPIAGRNEPPKDSTTPSQVDADRVHITYDTVLCELELSTDHREDLRRRGMSDAEIDRRRYRTLRNVDRGRVAKAVCELIGNTALQVPGFVNGEYGPTLSGTATGLVVPVRRVSGAIQALKIRQASDPKYMYLSGADGTSCGSPVHVPMGMTASADVVRVTEGELKADVCMALDSTPTIGIPGVTQWPAALPVLRELGAGTVVIAFDAPDVHAKRPVFEQAEAFWKALQAEGFIVEVEDW